MCSNIIVACFVFQILGNGMSNKMWEGTVEHAKTCVLSGKLHVYYADEKQNIGVIFNNIFQLMGLIADGSYMSVDSLSDSEKVGFSGSVVVTIFASDIYNWYSSLWTECLKSSVHTFCKVESICLASVFLSCTHVLLHIISCFGAVNVSHD